MRIKVEISMNERETLKSWRANANFKGRGEKKEEKKKEEIVIDKSSSQPPHALLYMKGGVAMLTTPLQKMTFHHHHERKCSIVVTGDNVPSLDDVLCTVRKTWRCFMRMHTLASFLLILLYIYQNTKLPLS